MGSLNALPYDPNKPTLTNYRSISKVTGAANRHSGVYKAYNSTPDKITPTWTRSLQDTYLKSTSALYLQHFMKAPHLHEKHTCPTKQQKTHRRTQPSAITYPKKTDIYSPRGHAPSYKRPVSFFGGFFSLGRLMPQKHISRKY